MSTAAKRAGRYLLIFSIIRRIIVVRLTRFSPC